MSSDDLGDGYGYQERRGKGWKERERERERDDMPTSETKRFPLRVLLTVTTQRLLTKSAGPRDNGIGDLYAILGWMTSDEPYTHQLPRFNQECRPWLLRWFPELQHATDALPRLDLLLETGETQAACEAWLEHLHRGMPGVFKAEYDVPKIPRDDHEQKNAYDELVAMRGTDEGIIVVPSGDKLADGLGEIIGDDPNPAGGAR